MSKKKFGWKKFVAAGVLTTSLGLGYWASKAFYAVEKVIDGDTFITTENRYIRLDSVDAPELNYCLGKESKIELEKLILGKKIFIKVTYLDNYKRMVASVFTISGNVGEKMLTKGLATYHNKGNQNQENLYKAAQYAKNKRIGVYSPVCTQATNPINPKCNIKGNTTGDKNLYRYPGCRLFNSTMVELHLGDKWYCTEKEALKAGFNKGGDCP
jgi:endonuclease YncB( thermonuclease family)